MIQMFGDLSIVILMGNFFQFPPINFGAKALWRESDSRLDEEGRMVWERFQSVIILEESMRHISDPAFQDMLTRAREGTMLDTDCISLNE